VQNPVDIRMPNEGRQDPLGQLGKRLLIGIGCLLITAVAAVIERDGYVDLVDGHVSILDAFYYATVSITTTGYGDVVPASDAARLFTTIVVTPLRMIFLVLLVGTSVELITLASHSIIRERNWRRRVKNHVVICGFGVKGRTALSSLLEQGTSIEDVVIIDPERDNVDEAGRIGAVCIHGDATSNTVLRAAQVELASIVIITPARDDTAVLVTLSARAINATARIVSAARELENAPLLRRSGADVVLTTSGATGRMMGMAAVAPHYVQVVEELLETGTGLDLVERTDEPAHAGSLTKHRREGELVIAVFRGQQLVARNPTGDFELEPGDDVVSVAAPASTSA
jgi:voltage-gated potassium channel